MADAREVALKSKAGSFFTKSPFLSFGFVANTAILAFCLGLDFYFVLRFWKVLPSYLVLLAPVSMLSSWVRVLKNRRRISELHDAGVIGEIAPGSVLETSLEVAEDALNDVLLYSFLANMILLAALWGMFRHS
jgi:hypothetical protein